MKIYNDGETLNHLIENAMEKLKILVDTSTIIGDPVRAEDGTTILPISKISVGYVVGGGEYADLSSRRVANHFPMAGGSSGGMSVSPVGFLVVKKGEVEFVNVENKTMYQTILNLFNTLLEKLKKEGKKDER